MLKFKINSCNYRFLALECLILKAGEGMKGHVPVITIYLNDVISYWIAYR